MKEQNTFRKIWDILYPLLLYFLLDLIVVFAVEQLWQGPQTAQAKADHSMISAIVFLVISIPLFFFLYRKDYNVTSRTILGKPWYFLLLTVTGALAAHGLSILISLMNVDRIIGNYQELEQNIFSANRILVILQTVLLAPVSEELLFRGILYKRLEKYIGGFWLPALISSFLFGLYHLNLAQGIFAFLFGFLSCAVYFRTRNLLAPLALHIGGNLVSVILVYSGFTYPSVWVSLLVMAAALAGAFVLFWFFIHRNKTFIA